MSCGHLTDMVRWVLALGALLAAAGPARARPPRCPTHEPPRCVLLGYSASQNEYTYTVDGVNWQLEFVDGGFFKLTCPGNMTLDNSALPRFEAQLRVNKVHLNDCPAPNGSYHDVLTALNVHVLDKLKLLNTDDVTRAHLARLDTVRALELVRVRRLAPDALDATPGLLRLSLDDVRPPPGELRLPPGLQLLDLTRMNSDVPAALLDSLPHLATLSVRDSRNVSVALGRHVHTLALELPAARVPAALPPALESLAVFGWDEPKPARWAACSSLHTLHVRDLSAARLPANWVGACAQLRVLRVEYGSRLRELDAAMLSGSSRLEELHITYCALTTLPTGLLDDAVNLTVLDLTGNLLQVLPGGLFVKTAVLQTLVLARNRLGESVFASLQAVTSLRALDLSFNTLRDSCGSTDDTVRGVSPLQSLKNLTYLNLKKTNTSLICRDWRDFMILLEKLDLSQNNFTSVTYADLQFVSRVVVRVNLEGNNVSRLHYTRSDYSRALVAPPSRADVSLDATLACDCHDYWAARALAERPAQLQVRADCAAGGALAQRAPAALRCAAPALCAGTRCACAWSRTGATPPRALHVRCERAGLTRLRDVTAPLRAALGAGEKDYAWRLHLAHNDISELDAADFPEYLSELDLSNNSLSTLSAAATRALLADPQRRVRLAGNPLDCACQHADTLRALRAQQQLLPDYARLTCAGGPLLDAAPAAPCVLPRGPGAGAVAAAAALLTLLGAAALAGLLWHPALRLRLKAALHRRGWLPAAPEDDAGRRYDAFVSFSHGDERFVRDTLVPRLEAPPAALRLCLHYRDWLPGGWIPAQIAASVRASRRTVAVVSAHFLRSAWARAEFQEAHALALRDARPRLVVVLLDDPAALPLDDRLRRYLETNTYVRWGDPFFWEKLCLALPRGRGPEPEPAPPVPAAPEPGAPEPGLPAPAAAAPDAPSAADASGASSLNSASSSSVSSSSSSAPSGVSRASSEMELDRLMPCGAQYAGAPPHYAAAHVPPV